MNRNSNALPLLLRFIIGGYLLIFLTGLGSSGYFLKGIVQLAPIPMIGLLKYILLVVLFLILAANAISALKLTPASLDKFAGSIRNFKWLFTIAVILSLMARWNLINTLPARTTCVTLPQISILVILAVFCFWSDKVFQKLLAADKEMPGPL